MRVGWGLGAAVGLLIPLAFFFFGTLGSLTDVGTLERLLAIIFLLTGGWTLAFAVFIGESKDRLYYGVWGLVLAGLSLFDVVPPGDAIGIFIIAIVVLILLRVYTSRNQEMVTAGPATKATPGATPAAGN